PLVYQKALEIHTTALNVATAYLSYRTQPGVYALAGAAPRPSLAARLTGADDPAPGPSVPGSATLEQLLGSMDYCACDECKSVLGAAAYFVDLLDFIDVAPVAPNQNPKHVLCHRRPDLEQLQLSCENTNIAVPYIDLVNEILEYWTIHGNLTKYTGFNMNTGDQTADLLADPAHVTDAAYDHTKAEVYPFTLPFDMPLEALRLLMQAWSTTLGDALRVFGTPLAARLERLELDAGETRILTDMSYRTLSEYFGEPAASSIDALNAAISNAKTFCTRTGIQYQDLVDLLGTTFINPGAPLVSLLTALQVSFSQLAAWYDHTLTDAQLAALLPTTLVIADYGGDVTAWLTANRALIMGLITLTETTADPSAGCSFANLQLRYTQPTDNALTDLAYWKLHRFIRLWQKLGWTIAVTAQIVTTFLGIAPAALTDANLDATFTRLVARLAAFQTVIRRQAVPADRIADWLAVWDATQPIAVRRELLAHLVRIGTTDLDHLIELAGIDPLADDLDADAPSILGLLDAWAALEPTGLKVVDVDYLLRSRDDAGAIAPTQDALYRDLAALRDGLTAIEVDLAAPPDNADLGYVAGKLALVYDAAVVNDFIGLFAGTTTYSAPLATVEQALPGPLVAADGKLAYDPFGKRLSHAGALSAATATALGAAADALTLADLSEITAASDLVGYVAAFKIAVAALVAAGAADLAGLAADYPELAAVYAAVAPIQDPAAQATALIAQITPALGDRLKTLALGTTLASQLKTDQLLVDVLTSGPAVLHAGGDPARPILDDLRGLEAPVALSANGGFALHLEPPSSDDYILYVAAPPGTTVTLSVAGAGAIPTQLVGATGEVATASVIALAAGTLTAVELTIDTLPADGSAVLRWRTKGMAKAAIPASRIYADAALAAGSASLVRLHKAAMLLRAIPLTPAELAHLAAVNPDTAGYLNALDVGGAITAVELHAQWVRFAWLAWFGALHASEPSDDTWVGLLANPLQVTPQGASVLAGAAGWAAQDLTDTLAHFGLVLPAPLPLGVFRKVKDAVDFATASTQTAANLIAWTTATPDGPLIAAIKDALRAGQDSTTWHTTLQSVNDALRNQRRDALVSYILHHAAPVSPIDTIDTADKLYEYFLIDVEMDACMQTSRIRLALSTVQLFAMRCLMNLEPEVSPQSIDAAQWQWMKRYRVWEANREIFLFPENWLVPELRDDKSSMFSELEAELLKVDITDDLAEDAYLAYLKKLDEVARLELVGSFLQQDPSNADNDVLHLFGRTNGNTHAYYYRRFEGNVWSPWDKMTLQIDGDLVFPVIWKTQLFVFWVSPVHKATGATDATPLVQSTANWGTNARVSADLNLVWGEYYQGKWTSPKSTDLTAPLTLT
ncbi:MAG TPA: neuraminidase-like domain-containing protein, partial [Kofleriaceae bacterium]|nr:neuraminidase-like domain-containing protein [Kofleriaceae bacterium]